MTTENPENAPAQPPVSKKDMTPEQRAAAIKAAQEKAVKMKADREAAKAAAAGGGTAVGTAVATAEPAAPAQGWRIPAAAAAANGKVGLARPDIRQVEEVQRDEAPVRVVVKRRQVLRGGAFAAIGGFTFLMIASFLNFFNPRHITGFGGIVKVPAGIVPKPGADPIKIFDAKAYVVNLKPGGGAGAGVPGSEKGGIVVLYQKCPHLGCTVPWRPDFTYDGTKGWFRCPCHGSTYTEGGGRVFGPAPRSMDTMAITFANGGVNINTGKITLGSTGDPNRAILPPA